MKNCYAYIKTDSENKIISEKLNHTHRNMQLGSDITLSNNAIKPLKSSEKVCETIESVEEDSKESSADKGPCQDNDEMFLLDPNELVRQLYVLKSDYSRNIKIRMIENELCRRFPWLKFFMNTMK